MNYLTNRHPNVRQKVKRVYTGVVLDIHGISYFAPLCSPKDKSKKWTSKKMDVFLIDSGLLGFLDFANMIPIHQRNLFPVKIGELPDKKYAALLNKQYSFINKHSDTILKRATTVYNMRINNRRGFKQCLDFKSLEVSYTKWK